METDPYALPVECPELEDCLTWPDEKYSTMTMLTVPSELLVPAIAALCALVREQFDRSEKAIVLFDEMTEIASRAAAQLAAVTEERDKTWAENSLVWDMHRAHHPECEDCADGLHRHRLAQKEAGDE